MRFGLILVPQVLAGQPESYRELFEQIELAEELGFESVWFTEHHFSEYGRPAVPALAGYAAARTSRIRVSTAVVVLPFHHPIRVAEDWATLDHLLDGRLDVGIGRGNQPHVFAGFAVSMNEARERYSESLDIIRKAWTEDSFSYDGEFWKIPELSVVPKPVQKPHPPLWCAALSASTVERVVADGINGLIGPYLCPFEVLKADYFDVWHEATRAAGRTDLDMCHNEFVYVGESYAQVREDVEEYLMWYIRKAARIWGERDRSKVAAQYANYNDILEYLETVTFDEVYENMSIIGTPDRVVEKLRWLRDEGGCDYVMNFMWFGGISHEKAMRNMELFAREVVPRLRDDSSARSTEPAPEQSVPA
jgi:alkanesulfonate monooxygenase SsuD/methylene tetrahydromethanopterin reductase-like flavin-dependent oxidoreductase (luciferase family)